MACAVREPTRCARGRPFPNSATTTTTLTADRRTSTPTATWSCLLTPRCRPSCPSTAGSSARRDISSITRFAVLASAIASRPLTVEETHTEATHTDGRTVFVAAGLDSVDVCDAVVVQAALLAGGALRKDLMMRLARHRPAVAQRYLALALGRERIPSLPAWAGVLRPSRLRRVSNEDLRASPTDRDLMRLGQLEEE